MDNFTVRYFVDEEKKVVVCKLEGCYGGLCCDMCRAGWPATPELEIADTFVGKAKCSDDDKFDVDLGKKITFKRAFAKYTKAKQRVLKNFIAVQDAIHQELMADVTKLDKKYDAIQAHKVSEVEYLVKEAAETN